MAHIIVRGKEQNIKRAVEERRERMAYDIANVKDPSGYKPSQYGRDLVTAIKRGSKPDGSCKLSGNVIHELAKAGVLQKKTKGISKLNSEKGGFSND